jgi:hypothetical protein
MARFVYQARREIAPKLRYLASSGGAGGIKVTESDRVFREMAVNNFNPNLKVLADKLNELYVKVAAIDKESAGSKQPVYTQINDLREIGRYLVE